VIVLVSTILCFTIQRISRMEFRVRGVNVKGRIVLSLLDKTLVYTKV
jgi:hypothetical protein